MSALPLRADILTICINVCLVPLADFFGQQTGNKMAYAEAHSLSA